MLQNAPDRIARTADTPAQVLPKGMLRHRLPPRSTQSSHPAYPEVFSTFPPPREILPFRGSPGHFLCLHALVELIVQLRHGGLVDAAAHLFKNIKQLRIFREVFR